MCTEKAKQTVVFVYVNKENEHIVLHISMTSSFGMQNTEIIFTSFCSIAGVPTFINIIVF